jgi:hypothetical protein
LLEGKAAEVLLATADRAHARFLTAAKALATIRKLVKPGLAAGEVTLAVVPGGPAEGRHRAAAG